jgi:hypothetical protein
VPDASGEKFKPHVTIGLASPDYLNKMFEEKFEAFTFSPARAAVYHLGNFGTAQEKLELGIGALRRMSGSGRSGGGARFSKIKRRAV